MSTLQQPRRALVVYGSETGNAQDVAEEMGRIAERLRFDTDVAELNAISLVCQSSRRCVRARGPC
jgi:flavodoxin